MGQLYYRIKNWVLGKKTLEQCSSPKIFNLVFMNGLQCVYESPQLTCRIVWVCLFLWREELSELWNWGHGELWPQKYSSFSFKMRTWHTEKFELLFKGFVLHPCTSNILVTQGTFVEWMVEWMDGWMNEWTNEGYLLILSLHPHHSPLVSPAPV